LWLGKRMVLESGICLRLKIENFKEAVVGYNLILVFSWCLLAGIFSDGL
jgi:hypothetical protein